MLPDSNIKAPNNPKSNVRNSELKRVLGSVDVLLSPISKTSGEIRKHRKGCQEWSKVWVDKGHVGVESKKTLLWKKSPTRVIRFWSYRLEAEKMSWAVPLCLLCSDTFLRHLLLGSTLAGFTSVARSMPLEWQVPGARCWGTCCFYSSLHFRSILSFVCSCRHDLGVLASFSPRHWWGTGLHMVWNCNGHASVGHQPAIVELLSASFLAGWSHPGFWCEAAWCALDSLAAALWWMFVWIAD